MLNTIVTKSKELKATVENTTIGRQWIDATTSTYKAMAHTTSAVSGTVLIAAVATERSAELLADLSPKNHTQAVEIIEKINNKTKDFFSDLNNKDTQKPRMRVSS